MYRSRFLDLGSSWRRVVSFTPRPVYSRGKSLKYSLNRRLSGLRIQSGQYGEVKILDPTGIRSSIPLLSKP
jgi:hypothetical protein